MTNLLFGAGDKDPDEWIIRRWNRQCAEFSAVPANVPLGCVTNEVDRDCAESRLAHFQYCRQVNQQLAAAANEI